MDASTYMHTLPPLLTEEDLARLAEQSGLDRPSLVVQLVLGDAGVAYHERRPLYPASMIKVPLVAAALLMRGGGLVSDGPIRIDAANLTANDGPSPLALGYDATLEELCTLAITRSDNIATNQLFDVLGRERATTIVREQLALRGTGFRRKLSGGHPLLRDPEQTGRNTFPACDAARLFTLIAKEAFAGASFLYSLLERQEWNSKLSAGLQPHDRFAHKTGDTDEVSHDGGILDTAGGRRYVVVVYTGSGSSPETDARFGTLMRSLRAML
jgi:beta-lactamase class A